MVAERGTQDQRVQQVMARLALLDLAPLDQRVKDRLVLLEQLVKLGPLAELVARGQQALLLRREQLELREQQDQQARMVSAELWARQVQQVLSEKPGLLGTLARAAQEQPDQPARAASA